MRAEYGRGLDVGEEDAGPGRFQWFHLEAGSSAVVVLGDPLPLWYRAHWFEGRMRPCTGEGCALCEMGLGKQRRWVFCVAKYPLGDPFLWEVSDQLAMVIKGILDQRGAQKDMKLSVRRGGSGVKGRIEVEWLGWDEFHSGSRCDFPDADQALELTWATLGLQSEFRSEEVSGSRAGGREY